MNEKEYIEICILSQPKEIATKNIIQLLEQKDKRIDELEKALVEEAIKSTEKINKAIEYIKTLDFSGIDCYCQEKILKILEE